MIKLFNTPAKKLQEFSPQTNGEVKLYTCGPTVYDFLHIGNWVAYIRWDVLVRVLILNDFKVNRVMNITDVGHLISDADEGEDKMEKGARREGKTAWQIAEMYTADFLKGMSELNLVQPTTLAKATDFIPEQIELIRQLELKGHTYVIDDGVYFDTSTFADYAKFAGLDLEAQKAGARVSVNTQKHNPSDFALWKFSPPSAQRDMEWDSPWGKGFPGWHLECSAIVMQFLGQTIDIHTGGIDHIPVHHTNEIAQSESATGKPLARYWLHNNHLLIDGAKIAKSQANGFTLNELIKKGFSAMDFRMFALQSHYRTQANFTWDDLTAAKNRLAKWREIAELRWQTHSTLSRDIEKSTNPLTAKIYTTITKATEKLNNDLNTPEALAVIESLFDKITATPVNHLKRAALLDLLQFIDSVLGLKLLETTPDITDDQKRLILQRQRAREAQDWPAADELRKQLANAGLQINDTNSTPVWSRI